MIELDMSTDYQCWDNPESVAYNSVRATGNMVDQLAIVKRRALTRKELSASGGAYTSDDVVFLVPRAMIQGLIAQSREPKPGDTVTDADQNDFTVLEATGQKRDRNGYQTFRLTTRNLTIAYDLQTLIDIQRASITYDPSGTKIKAWPEDGGGKTLYSQLKAKAQLLTDDLVEERGIKGFRGNYAVIVSKQVSDVIYEDRVKLPDGSYLEIQGVHNPSRIDELPVLDCLAVP